MDTFPDISRGHALIFKRLVWFSLFFSVHVALVTAQSSGSLRSTFKGQEHGIYPDNAIVTHRMMGDSILETSIRYVADNRKVIVEFDTPPLITAIPSGMNHEKAAASRDFLALQSQIHQEHARFRQDLKQIEHDKAGTSGSTDNVMIELGYSYELVYNGMALTAGQMVIDRISELPYVKRVHDDVEVKAFLEESVGVIGADQVWSTHGITGTGIVVGILDTGIDYMHPDLGGGMGSGFKVLGGYDFVNDDADPIDDQGHGTHVAGIVAANGVLKGVAPDASLRGYKVLNAEGSGQGSWIIAGIEQSVIDGVHVLNASLGGPGSPDDPMAVAINNASMAGVVCVVAAGNEGSGNYTIGSPGVAREALTIGATDNNDMVANFSSRGPVSLTYDAKPDMTAPGVMNHATMPGGNYARMSGTSMATPHVAGAVALFLNKYPDYSPSQVKSIFAHTAVDCGFDLWTQGAGRIDLMQAFEVPAFIVSPHVVNLGFVNNNQPEWTSTATIDVSNLHPTNKNMHITMPDAFIHGAVVDIQPADFTLSPGETRQIQITITVDNSLVPFSDEQIPHFLSKLSISDGADALDIPVLFFKSQMLDLHFDEEPGYVILFGDNMFSTGFIENRGPDISIPIAPGSYDMIVQFKDMKHLLYSDIAIDGGLVMHLSKQDAKNHIQILAPGIDGDELNLSPNISIIEFDRPTANILTFGSFPIHDMYFNDFSGPRWKYISFGQEEHNRKMYGVGDVIRECLGDMVLTYDPSAYRHLLVEYDLPADDTKYVPMTYVGGFGFGVNCFIESHRTHALEYPFHHDVYFSPGFAHDKNGFMINTDLYYFSELPPNAMQNTFPEYKDMRSQSPYFMVNSDGQFYTGSYFYSAYGGFFVKKPLRSASLNLDAGPEYFNGRLFHQPGNQLQFTNINSLFFKQTRSLRKPSQWPYTFFHQTGVYETGNIVDWLGNAPPNVALLNYPEPLNRLDISSDQYSVHGAFGQANVSLEFDINLDVGFVPFMTFFHTGFKGGYLTDAIGIGENAHIMFGLEFSPDIQATPVVELTYRIGESNEWLPLSLQEIQNEYPYTETSLSETIFECILPVDLPEAYISLRLTAEQGTGSKLLYEAIPAFYAAAVELPVVSADIAWQNIYTASASVSGKVISDGYGMITDRGFVWGPIPDITLEAHEGKWANGEGKDLFSGQLTDMLPQRAYYVRAYATNSQGTAYSDAILLENIPDCLPPHQLAVHDIALESVFLTWIEPAESSRWDILYGPAGFDPETEGVIINQVSSPYHLDNLSHSTNYTCYVRSYCDGEPSIWSLPYDFATECGPVTYKFTGPTKADVFNLTNDSVIPFALAVENGCDFRSMTVFLVDASGQEIVAGFVYPYDGLSMAGVYDMPLVMPSGTYKFIGRFVDNPDDIIESDPFEVVNNESAIAIVRPLESEYWLAGYEHFIAWNSLNTGPLEMHVSLDNGDTWQEIAGNIPSPSGYSQHGFNGYNWVVTGIPPGDYPQSLLRIRDAGNQETIAQAGPFHVSTYPPFELLLPKADTYVETMGTFDMVIDSRINGTLACMLAGDGFHTYLGRVDLLPGLNTFQFPTDQLIPGDMYYPEITQLLYGSSVYGGIILLGEYFTVQKATPMVDWPMARPVVYGEPAASVTMDTGQARVGQHMVPGSFVVATVEDGLSAGLHQLPVSFIPDDESIFNRVAGYIDLHVLKKTSFLGGTFVAAGKDYDGTALAEVVENNLILDGLVPGDDVWTEVVEAAFMQSLPGTDLVVSLREVRLHGADSENYVLSLDGAPTALASITGGYYHLMLEVDPPGAGSASGAGTYLVGQNVHLLAMPSDGYFFDAWTGNPVLDGAEKDSVMNFLMPANDLVLTARFVIKRYTVNYLASPGGSIAGDTPQTVEHGSNGTEVTALPDPGYHFVAWSDGQMDATRTDTGIINDLHVEAYFARNRYDVSVIIEPPGSGTVDGGGEYLHGDMVKLQAIATQDYSFDKWLENHNTLEVADQISFEAMASRMLIARFTFNTYLPEIEVSEISLFPNPGNSVVTIRLAGDQQIQAVRVYDTMGKEQQLHMAETGTGSVQINISQLNNGIYMVRVQTGVAMLTARMQVLR